MGFLLEALERIDEDYTCDEFLLESFICSLAKMGDPRAIKPIRKWQHYELENSESLVEVALANLEGRNRGEGL